MATKEEQISRLEDELNHEYLRKYIKHQKTSVVKFVNGPKNRKQYVKSRIALELFDKKIMLVSKILVLPEVKLVTIELQKWLEDQENLIKKNFAEYEQYEQNKEESGALEKAVHIENVMQTIIMAQKKSNEKKRVSNDANTQPPPKRRSTLNLENRDSIGSIDSEILLESIEEVNNKFMKFGDSNEDTGIMDEKPDPADLTLLGDHGIKSRNNETDSMSEKKEKVEYATNGDLI